MLTLPRLVLRNVVYHWRGNLAVLLGVAVGSTVLTGALLVGDSLRGSLRARVERQLGGIDAATRFPRPLRAEIADRLPGATAPVLLLPGSVQSATGNDSTAPSLGRVTVLGVDDRFKPEGVNEGLVDWNGRAKLIVLSDRVARKLSVRVDEKVKVGVERHSDLPRSSSLAKRGSADVSVTEEFTVAAILPAESAGNEFNLTPNPAAPLNVFVPIRTLSRLVFGEAAPRTNVLLATGAAIDELNGALRSRLSVDDYGLKLREIDRKKYVSIESEQLVLTDATVKAIESAVAEAGLVAEPTIVYVADTLAHGKTEIPYPIVAGLNTSARAPLGPFLPPGVESLRDDEMVLLRWTGSQLNDLPAGARIGITYFDPDVEGDGELKTAELTLRGYIPLAGAAQDRDLTPEIRGVTDPQANLYNWDRPPVLPNDRIRARVPEKPPHPRGTFFNANKATPMAYVNLATAKKLFGSRYGSTTSVRVASKDGKELPEQIAERLRPVLLNKLDPESAGLAFDPVRARLLSASKGGTDFGGLFLGFSCFLIAASLMLVGLLFRLALDRRAKEVGLLLATGYRVRAVRSLLLAEVLTIAFLGALVGLALGVAYNRLLLTVLIDLWPDKEASALLRPYSSALSFIVAFFLTILMSLAALWLSVRGLVKVPAPALLRGESVVASEGHRPGGRVARFLAIVTIPSGLGCVLAGRFVSNPDYQAMTFFAGGGLLLTAGLAAAWVWMKRTRHRIVGGRGLSALLQLGARNLARNATRSLLTAALLAAAAFLIVAVESFRRRPGTEFLDKAGGSGGFNLLAETDLPMFQSFDAGPGRRDLEQQLRKLYGGTNEKESDARYRATLADLDGIEVYPLRLRDGDDASCLNLFQASRPRVLGVGEALIARGGFKFYATEAETKEERDNPWLLLRKPRPDSIPVFCEQNTAQWMLKTAVGGEIKMPGDDGRELRLRIVGTFADSPFQSELVMSDEAFTSAFPKTNGYRQFLIRTPAGKEEAVARVLSTAFSANGLIAISTRERVAAYQAVIGAYLSTFQLLGGLGLVLGVLGLGIVVLRSVWERVGELALLRAVGYRMRELQVVVLAEHGLLLIAGVAIGVTAALVSVAPHVAAGADVPWFRLAVILGLVLVVGMSVAFAATAVILRVPVIPALRRE